MKKSGIGSHTKTRRGETNTWLTPQSLIEALGPFDLDPCAAPSPRPWPSAKYHIELPVDGLAEAWYGPWCYTCGAVSGCKYVSDGETYCLDCYQQLAVISQPYRCWVNPPYGDETEAWLDKLSRHKSGIGLIFARTETSTWHTVVWPRAHAIFFFNQRLWFYRPDGTRGDSNAGGPSALISYSYFDTCAIETAWERGLIRGVLVRDWIGRKWPEL